MFIIYENEKVQFSYVNKNSDKGVSHLTQVFDKSTDNTTGMWIDDSQLLNDVLELQSNKGKVADIEYSKMVALYIQKLIANGGYSSLKIASQLVQALQYHPDLKSVEQDLSNSQMFWNTLDSSCYCKVLEETNSRQYQNSTPFTNFEILKQEIFSFILTVSTYIRNILSQIAMPDYDYSKPDFLREMKVKDKKITASSVANALYLTTRSKEQLKNNLDKFGLWAAERKEINVTRDEVEMAYNNTYQLPS